MRYVAGIARFFGEPHLYSFPDGPFFSIAAPPRQGKRNGL